VSAQAIIVTLSRVLIGATEDPKRELGIELKPDAAVITVDGLTS
jgi:hypothetical protein